MRAVDTKASRNIERTYEINLFLNDARRYEVRSSKEQIDLCVRAQRGDKKAQDELVHCNLLFIFSLCSKFAKGNGILDLIGVATIGMLNSIPLFKPNQGVNFLSYAVRGMTDEVMQYINADKIVINKFEAKYSARIRRIREDFFKDAERYPTEGELAALLELEGVQADEKNLTNFNFAYFSDVIGDDDSTLEECGQIAVATATEDAETLTDNNDTKTTIKRLLNVLDDRHHWERTITEMFFGINCDREWGLDDIAAQFGYSSERVRQIKNEAVAKMHARAARAKMTI